MSHCEEIFKTKDFPSLGGAYLLLIDLKKPLTLPQKKFCQKPLEPGFYLYAGSAYGPGGIKARVSRHIKKRKAKRWHIDYITTQATVTEALVIPQANECAFISQLLENPQIFVPLKGMGSSDCKSCPSHFLQAPPTFSLTNFANASLIKGLLWKKP